jgi:hypothetical protein
MAPLVCALSYTQAENREQRLTEAHRAAMERASYVAGELRVMTSGIKNLLMALAHMPAIRSAVPGACSSYMTAVHKAFPDTIAIGAADIQGNVYCLGRPLDRPINVADRHHFQASVGGNRFAVGQYVLSRTTRLPSLSFGYPIRDASGKPVGEVFAVLSLTRLAEQLSGSNRARGVNVVVTDRVGVILADLPGAGRSGEAIDDQWMALATGAETQSTEITDPQTGNQLIAAFLPLQGDARGLTVAVALDKAIALRGTDVSHRYLLLVGAALILSLAAAALLGWRRGSGVSPDAAADTVRA